MTLPRQHHWLLCYDIADPRRLARIHRYMKDQGWPLQYSVFQLKATHDRLDVIVEELEQLMDSREDDIRIYPLHKKPRKVTIGKRLFDRGVMFFDNSTDLFDE